MKRYAVIVIASALVFVFGCDKGEAGSGESSATPSEADTAKPTEPAEPAAPEPAAANDVAEDKSATSDNEPATADDGKVPAGWEKRTSPEGGFTILAPTTGITQTSSTSTPAGPAKTTTMLYQKEGDPGALMVMYMDMPVPDGTPLAVERGLEDGRDRAVGTYNGKLTRDERISIDGNPGREFEFDANMPPIGSVHAIMRGAFRDKRVYMVGAVAKKGDGVYLGKGKKFVRSFTILPYTPPAAKKAAPKGSKAAPK